jgi:mannose-6-phosphate isomerase-like protein (cupin superfamily)
MAYPGQVLENPVSGETIVFRRTAADTDGELLSFDLTLTLDGRVPGTHVHPAQEERFEVRSGTMKFRIGFKKIIAGPGDTVVVPAGVRHRFELALFVREYEHEVRAPFFPAWVARILMAPVAAIGRRLGRGERYQRTVTVADSPSMPTVGDPLAEAA